MCGEEETLMASLNSVCLLGHLTRHPEVRYGANGTPVAALGLAVNTRIKRSDDSWQDEPCFVDVVVFGTQAEACAKYLNKGAPVLLEGRLRYRTWEDQQGNRRSKHEVIASRVQFLPKPGPRSDAEDRLSGASIEAEGDEDLPF
jgi:single-strand DNA-binding protein